MKHPALTSCLILAVAAAGFALPAAHAGGAITKCVDGAGRVTLTDQPCDAHTVTSAVLVPGTQADDSAAPVAATVATPVAAPAATLARGAAQRTVRWAPAAPLLAPHAALSGDMATMKQARVALLLQDAAPRNRLAAR